MSTDQQFTATGPSATGFQTTGSAIGVGANVTGKSAGGMFHATASGQGQTIAGVTGDSAYGSGFLGGNANDDSTSPDRPRGVFGESDMPGGIGVEGFGASFGVAGQLVNDPDTIGFIAGRDHIFNELAGVFGTSAQAGVFGNSEGQGGTGVHGRGGGVGGFGLRGEIAGSGGAAVKGQVFGPGNALAGEFIGNVDISAALNIGANLTVVGDVFLKNRDLAERFQSVAQYEAGSVMVLGDDAVVLPCGHQYDKRAVGVVSGAGTLRPAITLGERSEDGPSVAIALVGTVFCLVDASKLPVEVGDLLTTSETRGHAMKADDPVRSFGAVVGKSLARLPGGRGLIPIIVALQ